MITVLYVDDEEPLLEIGKLFLEDSGELAVDTAVSAQEALGSAQLLQYDAIVSDYQMPGTDGIGFLKQIRRSGNTVPFILFTGKGREEVAIQALNEGADFYLQKGGDPKSQFAELAHIIRRIVRHHMAEVNLRMSEERYRNVVEGQTEFISRFTPEGIHVFANDAYLRYFGKARDELIGHRFVPSVPEEDAPRLREHFASLTRVNPSATIEHRVVMPDGQIRWQQWADTAFFDRSGTITEYQSVGRDISDRKMAEEALVESKARLTSVLAGSPLPQFVIDRNHRIISWNRAIEEYSGIRAADVIGTDQQWRAFYKEKRPVLADLLVENDNEELARWYAGKLQPSRYVPGACESAEFFPHMGPAGKWLTYTAAPIRDAGGTVIGAIETFEDITERTRAADALRESEEKYRRIIETSLEGIWILDSGSRITYVNSRMAELLGYRPEEMIGRQVSDFVHPGDLADFTERMAERRRGITSQFERRYIRRDGSIITLLVSATPVMDEDGAYRGSFAMFTDITERKRAEDALRESEENYRTVFETTGTASIVVENDGTIVLANSEFAHLSGYAKNELENRKTWMEFIFHDDLAMMKTQHTLRRKDRKEALRHYEFRFVRRSGGIRDIYLTVDLIPGTTRSIASLLDITDRKRAEENLRQNGERYRSILADMQDVFYRSDREGLLAMASPSWASLLGYGSLAECIGEPVAGQVCCRPEDCRRFLDALGSDGHVDNYEICLKKKDGTPLVVSTSSHVYHDRNGEVAGVEGIFRDITAQKKSEDALRESEETFRALVEQSTEGIIIVDHAGRLLFANRRAHEIVEIAEDIPMDGSINVLDFVAPEDKLKAIGDFAEVARGHDRFPVNYRIITRENREGWVECIGTNVPFRKSLALLLSIRDVTGRRRVENALKESEERYRSILASIPDLMFIQNREGVYLDYHAIDTSLLAAAPEAFIGKSVSQVLPAPLAAQFLDSFELAHRTGQTRVIEYALNTLSGPKHFEARITPMDDQRQLTIVRDITDRVDAGEALALANRKLSLLTSVTRHDINNKLFALKGYLDLCRKNPGDSQKIGNYIREMGRIATVIERQIRFTKEYGDLEAGRQAWQNVAASAGLAAQEFDLSGIALDTSGLGEVEILASPMIHKVFSNLIDNALRHGGSTMTAIRFGSRVDNGRLIISCEDNGADIPAGEKEQIFVQGYGKNSGDGLFLVREILEISGITITENGEPGAGARFAITVPAESWRPAGNRD